MNQSENNDSFLMRESYLSYTAASFLNCFVNTTLFFHAWMVAYLIFVLVGFPGFLQISLRSLIHIRCPKMFAARYHIASISFASLNNCAATFTLIVVRQTRDYNKPPDRFSIGGWTTCFNTHCTSLNHLWETQNIYQIRR